MILAVDTETTGLDFHNGTRPFLVTTCDEDGTVRFWEWVVDPLTRCVTVLPEDVEEITAALDDADALVFHNSKFDIHALSTVGITVPWEKVHDTLIASHLLYSAPPHDLTYLAKRYLGEDILPAEEALEQVTQCARRRCRTHHPEWMIAKEGLPCMPSARNEKKLWKADTWLPKALMRADSDVEEYAEWGEVLTTYANADSAITMLLWKEMERLLKEKNHWLLYLERLKVLPVAYRMERRGVTVNTTELNRLLKEFTSESIRLKSVCEGIARDRYGYKLDLPESGRSDALTAFVFGPPATRTVENDGKQSQVVDKATRLHGPNSLNLVPYACSEKTGVPTFDADTKERYELDLKPGFPRKFIECLNTKSELDTARNFLTGYKRFAIPETALWSRLYPNVNPTGTSTLQWSHNNPNSANISRQSRANLRRCFGPAPGRVWYSMDAQNLQLRIPAYEAGETDLIEVFDHPEREPYYGSYHLVIFDILHPEVFAKHGKQVKDDNFENPELYRCVKNGNFARQFGGQKAKVDATFRVPGAYDKIAHRFPKIDALSQRILAQAAKYRRVYTIPDKLVDVGHGYPLVCRETEWGGVSPTVPFCYHVAGTAQWWMQEALIEVDAQLEAWRKRDNFDGHLILQIHDEGVVDFPADDGSLTRVISGGQTGADQGGLRAASEVRIPTGGWINRGFKTLDGPQPGLASFGLVELDSDFYNVRTYKNVESADATIRIATNFNSAGERCTLSAIQTYGKPHIDVNPNCPQPVEVVVKWLRSIGVKTLNVAGNAEKTSPGIGKFTTDYLTKVFRLMNSNTARIHSLKKSMEQCGDRIGVPTPVTVERHDVSWAVGVAV